MMSLEQPASWNPPGLATQQAAEQHYPQQQGSQVVDNREWREWSLDEHSTLCKLIEQDWFPQLTGVERCLRLAAQLPQKTARDVALRLRWMATAGKQQDPGIAGNHPTGRPVSKRPRSRRRGSRQSSFKISQAMKDTSSEGEEASEGDGSSGPQLPKAASMRAGTTHTDASCTVPSCNAPRPWQAGRAGVSRDPRATAEAGNSIISSLVEQNYSILASFRANMAQAKVAENTELLLKYRDNIATALENMAAMPGVMSRMPALPVKPSLEAASRLLPPMATKPGPRPGHIPFGRCGMGPRCQCPQRLTSNTPPPATGMPSMQLMPPPPPPPHDLPNPPPFSCMPPPPISSMDLPRPPVASLPSMAPPSCPLPPPIVDPPLPHAMATFPPFQPPPPLQTPVSMPPSGGASNAATTHSMPPPTLPMFPPPGTLPHPTPSFACSLPLQQQLHPQRGGTLTPLGPFAPPLFPARHHHHMPTSMPCMPPHAPAQLGVVLPQQQQQQQQQQQCSSHPKPCHPHLDQLHVHAPAELAQPHATALPGSMACSTPSMAQAPRSPLHAQAPGSPLHVQQQQQQQQQQQLKQQQQLQLQHQHGLHGLHHHAPPFSPSPQPLPPLQQQHALHSAAAHHHLMVQGAQGPFCPYPQVHPTSLPEVFHPPGSPIQPEDLYLPPHLPAPGPDPFLPRAPPQISATMPAAPAAAAAPPASPPAAAAEEPIFGTAGVKEEPRAASGPIFGAAAEEVEPHTAEESIFKAAAVKEELQPAEEPIFGTAAEEGEQPAEEAIFGTADEGEPYAAPESVFSKAAVMEEPQAAEEPIFGMAAEEGGQPAEEPIIGTAADEGEPQAAAESIFGSLADEGEPQAAAAGPIPATAAEEEGLSNPAAAATEGDLHSAAVQPPTTPAGPATVGAGTQHNMAPFTPANGDLESRRKEVVQPAAGCNTLATQVGGQSPPTPAHAQGQQLSKGIRWVACSHCCGPAAAQEYAVAIPLTALVPDAFVTNPKLARAPIMPGTHSHYARNLFP
ncbi:hypothetical protein DUNSADRAFT_401 [Dunaliella salina]|uniref:Myb-like domain-containing protein n=1 Tax=Dunaliella salina TaxID=3046 RepID=A0ABQ7FZ04_DUNSA|nr:hypothetical protein DUNSADRAFT_401 [Dunaliella salina]|eukprot:KAF5827587.1 hypothetical protein DUNSADRAFT_401 [Dunaliella salina]